MNRRMTLLIVVVVAILMCIQNDVLPIYYPNTTHTTGNSQDGSESILQPDESPFVLRPGEQIYRYSLSDLGWSQWQGYANPLTGKEFGNATHSFFSKSMSYTPGSGTTTTSVAVPTGTEWEAYRVATVVSSLTENRTWVKNYDLSTPPSSSDWTAGTTNAGSYSTPYATYNASGHGSGNGCMDFSIVTASTSSPYYYDAGDKAYITQTMTIPRGRVVWAALRLQYWAWTGILETEPTGLEGEFSLYALIENMDIPVWELLFGDIEHESTWYSTGFIFIPTNVFNLPADQSVTLRVGFQSKQSIGYDTAGFRAKIDNVELYVKTYARPTDVNLMMNGLSVASDGYGSGHLTQTPALPWRTNPVLLNYSWTPSPSPPDPNRPIGIEFDVTTNMFARRLTVQTVYDISPTAYGEFFTVGNGSAATFTTYHYANIPAGYPYRYYFNLSIPTNRDVFFVARPLSPATNLTTGVTGGDMGDGYLNVSAYLVTTPAGCYGYWRVMSRSSNIISNLQMYDFSDSTWKRTVGLRAGGSTRIRTYVGASYLNSVVNFTIYSPTGSVWWTTTAIVDASGYATTTSVSFPGNTAPAGSWMVQAFVDDSGTSGSIHNVGFFKRVFTVTHRSEMTVEYPYDAVGTWTTNVTYGDLMLVIISVKDLDSDIKVSGGTLQFSWALGSGTFDDSGTGSYTRVFDTSLLAHAGQYGMSLSWTESNFDPCFATLTINVNYEATLTSPQYPGISGPIGANQHFTVLFKNVNGTGITGATLKTNWSLHYSVTPQSGGYYRIDLTCTGLSRGVYVVNVTASASFVEPTSLLMYVTIREIYNIITYSSTQLSIPLGESASFTLTWTEYESGMGITGGASYISCNWTPFHSYGQPNYTVVESSAGVYNITIYTVDTDPLTLTKPYIVAFNVARPKYQNHTFTIGVIVRSHNTMFTLDAPIEQTAYGHTASALVYFEDTDLGIPIRNDTGEVRITVSSPYLAHLQYSVTGSLLGDGHYNITFNTNQWGSVGWKDLVIHIQWTGSVLKYYEQTIYTSVRVLGTATDLRVEQAPTATYYLDSINFTVYLYDMVNGTRVSNSTHNLFVLITPLTTGHPVTQADFLIYEIGTSGTYRFILSSSEFEMTGSFRFRIDFMWRSGVAPFYENDTLTVLLVVLERPTYIDYLTPESVYYGQTAYFTFSFVDLLTSARIPNSSALTIEIVESGVVYTVSYDSMTKTFTLAIDTTTLGGAGTLTLHLTVSYAGTPFYSSVIGMPFQLQVNLRASQLTHAPLSQPQWGNNITITFQYTDLVSGSSVGLTGILTLDAYLSGWYSVTFLGDGVFVVVLNTSGLPSDGLYMLTATVEYTGSNYVADATDMFWLSVTQRYTQAGYESPDPAPYLSNVTFRVSYKDDSTGRGIDGAILAVACSTSAHPLSLGNNYWIISLGNGQYEVRVSTVALGSIDNFVLQVNMSYSGPPFYQPLTLNIVVTVVQRPTQILLVQTPPDTPFGENVTFRFRFVDSLTGGLIAVSKANINLSHGPSMTPISAGQYSLYARTTYYEISFVSTLLSSSSLVTSWSIQMSIDMGTGEPYYGPRSTSTRVTTVERPTSISFPLVEATPYGDNITIMIFYYDYLTAMGISGADVSLAFVNQTYVTYYVTEVGGGYYRVRVPSSQFGGLGVIYFNISVSKAGIPFYASRAVADIPATIRSVLTSLLVSAPPLGASPPGVPMMINVTFFDSEHSVPLTGAMITTDWAYGVTIYEIGGGEYRLVLNTTGLIAQKYTFRVWATLQFYQDGSAEVTVQPGAWSTVLQMERNSYYVEWGTRVQIRLLITHSNDRTPVPGMNVTLVWAGYLLTFDDLNNGTYSLDLDVSIADVGIYQPQVTASRKYYETRMVEFLLVVYKTTGVIVPEQSFYQVVIDTAQVIQVYINDTTRGMPVNDAIVTLEWNNTVYDMTYTGVPGLYSTTINFAGFNIGPYTAVVHAFYVNILFNDLTLDIYIVPIPTELNLVEGSTLINVYPGDTIVILVEYNDTYYGGRITGAVVEFVIGSFSGVLIEQPDGTYYAEIDTRSFDVMSTRLTLTATKDRYNRGTCLVLVNILPIPTEILCNHPTQSNYIGKNVAYLLTFKDTHTNTLLVGANVTVFWTGGPVTVTDLGNGSYIIQVDIAIPQPWTYNFDVHMYLHNHATATFTLTLIVLKTPAIVIGPTIVSVPINDTVQFAYSVINELDNLTVSDINGYAVWAGLFTEPLSLLDNGSYVLTVPSLLPIGIYRVELFFSTTRYALVPLEVEVIIRPVHTVYYVASTTLITSPGTVLEVRITYFDTDHNVGIAGATISVYISGQDLTYYPATLRDLGDGTYVFLIQVNNAGTLSFTVTLSKDQYDTQQVQFVVLSNPSEAQQFFYNFSLFLGGILIVAAAAGFYYVKVLSIPKTVRQLNKMIAALARSRVPIPPAVLSRHALILQIVNEELRPLVLRKTPEEVDPEPIKAIVPEVDELLQRLVEITGLGPAEIEAFRADLSRMPASERPGFLREVIKQEEARRAEQLARAKGVEVAEEPTVRYPLEGAPEYLVELRRRLEKKGLGPDEIEIIIEQAKTLSKADLEALLDSLGLGLE